MRFALAAAAIAACVVAAVATAKEGGWAHLTSVLPLDALPGKTVRVTWTVDVPDGKGGRAPFDAAGMFVQLLSRTGAPASRGTSSRSHGKFAATLSVPAGGIGGLRLGLQGSTAIFFPVANDPFVSPGGVHCDVRLLQGTLAAFVRAYNSGDAPRLERLFSRDRFVWYSAGAPGARFSPEAENRATLGAYFRDRHRFGDQLRLSSFRFNGYDAGRLLGHFELTAQRRAADFDDGRWFPISGKGALDCSRPPVSFVVVSLGGV